MKNRFFLEESKISGSKAVVEGEEFLHLSKVLRLRESDDCECFFDGSDIFKCIIESIGKNAAVLNVTGKIACKANPQAEVTVFQALPKADKFEFIVQKLSELGVSKIVPFISHFVNTNQNSVRIERLHKIAVAAGKQCGRTAILKITEPIKFDKMLTQIKDYDCVVFANETMVNGMGNMADTDSSASKEILNKALKSCKNAAIIIGSEGGFDKEEAARLIDAGAVSVALGNRILRTETASVAATTLVMHYLGEI